MRSSCSLLPSSPQFKTQKCISPFASCRRDSIHSYSRSSLLRMHGAGCPTAAIARTSQVALTL
ncbi:hypothetical protein BDV29DRAFT_164177 [Aspergillus leporis]|uniref:Uncharacterized protein n=1 Tax=Aspergillus leporis TaxID=41062 RepID=A0A5N5XG18_9EURO|nr:hypothetical protein BDV29DRAFT_164177 [Aspergillus leporis]